MSGTIIIPQRHDFVDRTAMASVDTLFGLLADLWPIIHRLASLAEVKRKLEKGGEQLAINSSSNNNNNDNNNNNHNPNTSSSQEKVNSMRTDFETKTSSIELALLQWIPKIPASVIAIENQADESRLQSIINNAEAHKQAGFVYLYRTLLHQANPRPSPKVQTHVKQALQACLRVVIFSGPMAALVWPLFTAGCEAAEDVDRNVARTVFRHLETRQGMNNIVTAWEVCEEVWRRTDDAAATAAAAGGGVGQAEIDWRDVSDDMGREVIFG